MSYFLENTKGEIVRALNWTPESNEDLLHILQRHDNGRIEASSDLTYLEQQDVQYTLIKTFSKLNLDQKFFNAAGYGSVRLVENAKHVLPSVQLQEDDEKKFVTILKKTTVASVLLSSVIVGLSFVVSSPKTEEPRVVEIFERPKKEIVNLPNEPKKQLRQVVSPSSKKITPRIAKNQTLRKATKPVNNKISINQTGALSVLGSLSSGNQKGGLNLNKVKSSAGIGQGGTEGSGGMQTSIYSKGLVAAPLGTGQRAQGAGGYGTRGKGGGQAGYGKISIVGSAGSFFQPVETDALVEGGLDKNEIAAVIQRHLGEVRYCYEQGLQQKPNLAGRVSMKFIIGANGKVSIANVSSSNLGSPSVEGCIRDRLKTWLFPQPRGGVNVKVSYPFMLRRVSDS
jgi:hypothetical protein